MKIISLLSVFAALFLSSCAHHRDVRAGAEGVHRVVIQTDDTEEAARDAIQQAEHYCSERAGGKSAVFIEEDKKYTGDMKEDDYKKAKTVAKVAKGVGAAGWIFGGDNERKAGGVVGLGGGIADGVIGKGYTVEMKFKCQ